MNPDTTLHLFSAIIAGLSLLISIGVGVWRIRRDDLTDIYHRLNNLEIFQARVEERIEHMGKLVDEHEETRKLRASAIERQMLRHQMGDHEDDEEE